MLKINLLNNAFKSLIIILPLLSSLICYLVVLNLSIWIYDEGKAKQSIKKSKKVFIYGLVGCIVVSILFFISQMILN